MAKISKTIKIHGGKDTLAPKIIALMPKRYLTYCEPYFGGGSVLLGLNPEGHSEIANDLDGELMNFWDMLASEFGHLQELLERTPFSEMGFNRALRDINVLPSGDLVRAACFFIRCRQSLAGRRKDFTAISSTRVRRGMNEQVSAWLTAIEGLPEVHARIKRVLMLNRPAVRLIQQVDNKGTVFYLDPPYLQTTRATVSEYGQYEMKYDDHVALLDTLVQISGKFLLSGYESDLYAQYAKRHKWKLHKFTVSNSAAGGSKKRKMTECVWTNY